MKWWKTHVSTENSRMTPTSAIFTSTYHTEKLNHGQNDQQVLWQIIANCQLVKGRGSHLKSQDRLWTYDKAQKQATTKETWQVSARIVSYCVQLSFDGALPL